MNDEKTMQTITLTRPDDFHVHFRDGDMLEAVLPHTSKDFGRAIVMPNLIPPVVTSQDATAYKNRILAALPKKHDFTPLMTLYLTENSDGDDIIKAHQDGLITAVKLYPAGATTNSQSGVRNIDAVMPILEKMALHDVPLCVHGEVTHQDVDIFDREAFFIEEVLIPLRHRLPELKITMEHITTKEGRDYVLANAHNVGATITTHHLIINRNHMLVGGIKPHYYCLPVAKRDLHRLALVEAATSGDKRFFLGTDSAPHFDGAKENACGCAGVFSATNTMSCLAHVFEAQNALDKLEGFTSLNGASHYGLMPNSAKITLVKQDEAVDFPEKINVGQQQLTLFNPAFPLHWRVV